MADQSNGGQDRPNGRKANGSNPTSFGNRDKEVQEEEASGSNQPSLGNRDLEKIVSSVNKELRQKSPLPAVACIFRVPEMLRRANDNKIFKPELVSFGPFHHEKSQLQKKEELLSFGPFHPPLHHEKPQLQKMEEIKYWYLQRLLNRKPTPATTLECFVQAIGNIEQECRACYAEEIPFDKDEFVKMMVVDGCFIIEFFRYFRGSQNFEIDKQDDPVFNSSWMIPQILTESLLLENQLPWRVLTLLFDMTDPFIGTYFHLQHDLTLLVADSYIGLVPLTVKLQPDNKLKNKHKHLLDFLQNCLLGSYVNVEDTKRVPWIDHIPSVTELLQAGVQFKRKENQALRSKWQRFFRHFGMLFAGSSPPPVDAESQAERPLLPPPPPGCGVPRPQDRNA